MQQDHCTTERFRICHLSDSHFSERGDLADIEKVHRRIVERCRLEGVGLIVHTGDLYDRKSSPAERNAAATFIRHAASVAPVVLVKGNHDFPGDLDILRMLDTAYPVTVITAPAIAEPCTVLVKGEDANTGETFRNFSILGLPWFDKQHVTMLEGIEDGDEAKRRVESIAGHILTAAGAQTQEAMNSLESVPLFAGHLMVAGSEVSSGQTLYGTTVEMTPHSLMEIGCPYVALGHIHKAQQWNGNGRAVAYPGSPTPHNFGEPEEKSWNLVTLTVEWDEGKLIGTEVDLQAVPTKARKIVLLEEDFRVGIEDGIDPSTWAGDLPDLRGADVRFRFKVLAQHLHLVDQKMIVAVLDRLGASTVKVEPVVEHQARERVESFARAESLWEKVEAYLDGKEVVLNEEEKGRLREKVAELEAGYSDMVANG